MKIRIFLFFLILFLPWGVYSQTPHMLSSLQLLGTRSWIRVKWNAPKKDIKGFHIYWSTKDMKPKNPSAAIMADKMRYYIKDVQKKTLYYIWVESFGGEDLRTIHGKVYTKTKWEIDAAELASVEPNSSKAVPDGMKLYWHDEFNDLLLNRNKWFPTYYSTIDYLRKESFSDLKNNTLPKATYQLKGQFIDLFVNDSLPKRAFFPNGKKISSIQTYDWATDVSLLDNSKGGYFEVRVRRGSKGKVSGLNTAFWFDSPGPDLRYYLPKGATVNGTTGIRPKGQLFEIDMFEMLSAQFVMHGKVDSQGHFIHNLATDIARKYKPKKYVPDDGDWVTFGLLWTPSSIKHYINGRLIKSYDNLNHIYSPNHFMNVLLGSYGKGGSVNMQVDYIRYYRWPVSKSNELPNPSFEANSTRLPWHGNGTLSNQFSKLGKHSLRLNPGEYIQQYVYLDNNENYQMTYFAKGDGKLLVKADNIQEVTGKIQEGKHLKKEIQTVFSKGILSFKTKKLNGDHLKIVRIRFKNVGSHPIFLDNLHIASL